MAVFGWMSVAFGQVDPACEEVANGPAPEWYVDDAAQQDFLLNYFALVTTFSPLHAPIPDEPGHGSISLEMSVIPPLSCDRRLVFARTKTEDTNKSPILPRPRGTFTFPAIGHLVIFGGIGYVPPVTVFGTRNVIASGEVGAGYQFEGGFETSLRYHYTLMKTIAEIAGPFTPEEPVVDDFYVGSTFGLDLMAGYRVEKFVPYLALGFTDGSTFFYIGDDGFVGNNSQPYLGPTASLGAQGTWKHLVLAGELYAAPGLFDRAQGQLMTVRFKGGGTF
jgi:hypothetical protein